MTRIYENRGLARRMTGSAVVCAIALGFGAFELWRAVDAPPGGSGYGYLFAAFFVFGAIYGFRQLRADYLDGVVSLDMGPDAAEVALWRPLGKKRIGGPPAALTGWRREILTLRRNLRVEMLLADHPGHPRPLRFEEGRGVLATDAFRALSGRAKGAGGGTEPSAG
jgi:hypothetical protein